MNVKVPFFSPRQVLRAVEVLAFPTVQLLDVSGPLQVFATANELALKARKEAPYALRIGKRRKRRDGIGGLVVAVLPLSPTNKPLDTLIVAGGPGVHAAAADAIVLNWMRKRADFARRTA
jgi:transcriptional regulator GlxA family with amidase domain